MGTAAVHSKSKTDYDVKVNSMSITSAGAQVAYMSKTVADAKVAKKMEWVHPVVKETCDICDSEEFVQWFCIDCDEKFCDRCKTGHLRSKKTRNDNVIPLQDAQNKIQAKPTKPNAMCSEHPTQVREFYCVSCNVVICGKCLDLAHKSHKWRMTEDVLSEKKVLVNNKRDGYRNCFENDKEVHSEYLIGIDQISKEIENHAENLINEVKRYRDEQLAEMSYVKEQENKRYASASSEYFSKIEAMDALIRSLDEEIRVKNPPSVIDTLGEANTLLFNFKDLKSPQVFLPRFISGNYSSAIQGRLNIPAPGVRGGIL